VGFETAIHVELILLGEPSSNGLLSQMVERLSDEGPCWSSGSPVQELVRATHCKIDTEIVDIEFDCAGGVGQIPHDECSGRPATIGELPNIAQCSRLVVDDAAYHHGNVIEVRIIAERSHVESERFGDAGNDVAISGKFVIVDGEDTSIGAQTEADVHTLIEIESRVVVHGDFAGLGSDDGRHTITDPARKVQPVNPTTDQVASPLVFDDLMESSDRGLRCATERISIEIDQRVVGNQELVSKRREGILGIEVLCPSTRSHGSIVTV
jgi:hypothetical protein